MEWAHLLRGICDTAIYSLVGIIMMIVGIFIVILLTPFSVKKEIEDDQNTALGIIIGAIILGIAIIVASVIASPSSPYSSKKEQPKTEVKAEQ